MDQDKFTDIDAYHAAFPENVRKRLNVLRKLIKEAIPEAEEVISYNMPAFKINKVVVYYSAYKNHISLYPAPVGKEWEKDFKSYNTSGKGTIQFPHDKPIPPDLVNKIVAYRAKQDQVNSGKKKPGKR